MITPRWTVKAALGLVGTLSKPSKMPGHGYGLPAQRCITGSKLHELDNTVCSKCYALKGRYVFPNVKAAQEKRFHSLRHEHWVPAISFLIQRTGDTHFRWHDSGDLQGVWHLRNIVAVALACPTVFFWLPTRERKFVNDYNRQYGAAPDNLVVRVSGTMIDGAPPEVAELTSVVTRDPQAATCPAPKQGGVCGDCRACWSKEVKNVSYTFH